MIASVPIGIRRRQIGAKDAHGNDVHSWGDPEPALVYLVYPAEIRREPPETRDLVMDVLKVLAPTPVQPGPHDLVVYRGLEYEIAGRVVVWNDGPFAWDPGVAFNLKRMEG